MASTFQEQPDTRPPQDDAGSALVPASPVSIVLWPFPAPDVISYRHRFALVAVLLVCMLVAGGLVTLFTTILNPSGITITLVPRQQIETTPLTLTGLQINAHAVIATSAIQRASGPATGTGQQVALAAQGQISFFNIAPYDQTVPAGTVLSASGGIQVRTLFPAIMPTSVGATQGIAIVPARVLQTGSRGNLPVGAINASCCAPGIWAKNMTPFTGGQDGGTYTFVVQRDIDTLVRPLFTQASHEAQLTLHLQPGEQLVPGSTTCTPSVQADHAVGSHAALVTVSVSVRCQGMAYQPALIQQRAQAALLQQASRALSPSYRLHGSIVFSHVEAIGSSQGLLLTIRASGTWTYQLDRQALLHLLARFTGKPAQDAQTALLALPGVAQVQMSGAGTLPATLHEVTLILQA